MSLKKESLSDVQLHLAALNGDTVSLLRILDSGKVHVDCRDQEGTSPLILAAANGHYQCVKELLEQGADPNAKRTVWCYFKCMHTGTTALFFASQAGFLDIVQLLLNHKANVNATSVDGSSPLFVACQGGYLGVAKELVKWGGSINIFMKDRATPLFIASQNGHNKIVQFLLSNGAIVDCRRCDGATPLWIAAQMGHDHIVTQLLKNGANVDAARNDNATPLFKAAHKGHCSVIAELLRYQPNLGLLKNGESALHVAALSNKLAVCKQLIAAGADPKLVNQDGQTASQVAERHNHHEVSRYLSSRPNNLTIQSACVE